MFLLQSGSQEASISIASIATKTRRRKVKFVIEVSSQFKAHCLFFFLCWSRRSPRSFQLSLFSPFYILLSFPFARHLLCGASLSLFRRSFSATVFTALRKRERERKRKRAILSLFYSSVSGPANGWKEQGRHRQNREEYESCGEANERRRLSRVFFSFFSSLITLHAFRRIIIRFLFSLCKIVSLMFIQLRPSRPRVRCTVLLSPLGRYPSLLHATFSAS